MTTIEWIIIAIAFAASMVPNGYLYWASMQNKAEAQEMMDYVCKANADFAEAALLLKYGAVLEAVETLEPYRHELVKDTE